MKNKPVMMADITATYREEQDWLEGFMDASIHYEKAYGTRKALRMVVALMRAQRGQQGDNVIQIDLARAFTSLWQIYKDNQRQATFMYKVLINV